MRLSRTKKSHLTQRGDQGSGWKERNEIAQKGAYEKMGEWKLADGEYRFAQLVWEQEAIRRQESEELLKNPEGPSCPGIFFYASFSHFSYNSSSFWEISNFSLFSSIQRATSE